MSGARARGALWLAAALALLATQVSCREAQETWAWSPDTAALVEGQPITMAELNQVLGWGLYGQLDREEGAPAPDPETVPRLVLEKMIEERLILAEAGRLNFSIEETEKEISPDRLEAVHPDLPPAQAEALRRNLLRQLVLHKITARIMAEERRFLAAEWRTFWEAWPRKRPTRYLVRVFFLPSSQEAPRLPKFETLDQLAQNYKLEGFPAILSAPVWLQSDRLDSGLQAVLENAWASRMPSPPIRQDGSWAVYEVQNLDRKSAAVAELKAARAAYELKTGEEAFRRWLTARRGVADIRINPNLFRTRE